MLEAAIRIYLRCSDKLKFKHFLIALGILFGIGVLFTGIAFIGSLMTEPLKCIQCGNKIADSGGVAYHITEGYICGNCYLTFFD